MFPKLSFILYSLKFTTDYYILIYIVIPYSTALIPDELTMTGAYVPNSSRETWKRTYNPPTSFDGNDLALLSLR